ncbi:MAG TPA: hypothetical protein PLP42_16565 [Acidobacteriota bacterium]|nr:hypothetical protein [Acidobacteriota bacterium]
MKRALIAWALVWLSCISAIGVASDRHLQIDDSCVLCQLRTYSPVVPAVAPVVLPPLDAPDLVVPLSPVSEITTTVSTFASRAPPF